ncbi:MAG: hypothetical protein QG635_1006 [Bacteroidota bacterium]|nr:hypothetical protein [Bacteroidota bacterium]
MCSTKTFLTNRDYIKISAIISITHHTDPLQSRRQSNLMSDTHQLSDIVLIKNIDRLLSQICKGIFSS